MAHTHQQNASGWTDAHESLDGSPRRETIGFSEHVVRLLVLGLAAAYTYILLS